MKMPKPQIVSFGIAAMILAGPTRAEPAASPGPLVITQDNLAQLLFKSSSDVAREMNNVMRAKDNVAVALGNLTPTLELNVGAVVSNPPFFLVSSVSCLVPFLFPSSWYGYDAARKQAVAEASGLEITELNALASANALLIKFSSDERTLGLLKDQLERSSSFVDALKEQLASGAVPDVAVLRAELDLDKLAIEVSKLSELVGTERAALRKMFGLAPDQGVRVELASEAPSLLEDAAASPSAALDRVYDGSPERRQLELLTDGARSLVRASRWAFLDSCSGTQGAWGPTTSNAFTFSSSLSLSIGYGTFPQIDLSKRNLQDLLIRQGELRSELGRILDAALQSAATLRERVARTSDALALARRIETELSQPSGVEPRALKDLLDASNATTRAAIDDLGARATLDSHRVTLKRLAIEGQFLDALLRARHEIETQAAPVRHRSGD